MLRLCLVLIISVFSAQCTRSGSIPQDTLVVAMGAEPVTLDPRFATDAYGMRTAGLIYSSITRLGPRLNAEPDAAESWTQNKRNFKFILRKDLFFHNGRKVTIDDIDFSFAEFMKPGRPFASILEVIRQVTAIESNGQIQINVELKHHSSSFLTAILPIVKILPKIELQSAPFTPLGSGPYKFITQTPSEISMEAVRAKTKYLKLKIIRDDYTRYQKTLNGEIDINPGEIAVDKVAEFERRPQDFTVHRGLGLSMAYLVINFKDPLLKQKAVRLALAQSLDRQELIRYKLQGFATEATSILTPDNPYFNSTLTNPPLNLDAATATIERLGLKGTEVSLKTSNAASAVDNGKVLAHQLARSGLKFKLQSFEWATYYDDIKKGRFQLATMRWVGIIDPDFYRQIFHSSELPPGRNRGAYANPDLDALLLRGFQEENELNRRKIYAQVQKIVQDDLAMIPLWYDQQISVVKKSVMNYRPQQTGDYWPLIDVTKNK